MPLQAGLKSGTSSEASSPSASPSAALPLSSHDSHEPVAASLRMPDAVVLFYPVLNFCLSPSPSRVRGVSLCVCM
jgi:hypothetical protein